MTGIEYSPVGIPNGMMEIIRKISAEIKLSSNTTEFVLSTAREKVEIYQKAILDQKEVNMYYSRRDQIKAESRPSSNTSVSLTHNRTPVFLVAGCEGGIILLLLLFFGPLLLLLNIRVPTTPATTDNIPAPISIMD